MYLELRAIAVFEYAAARERVVVQAAFTPVGFDGDLLVGGPERRVFGWEWTSSFAATTSRFIWKASFWLRLCSWELAAAWRCGRRGAAGTDVRLEQLHGGLEPMPRTLIIRSIAPLPVSAQEKQFHSPPVE